MDISLSGGRLWAYNSRGTSKVTMVIAHAPWYNTRIHCETDEFLFSNNATILVQS